MAYVRSGSQQPTGNAVAGDVKSGKTFSNENNVDLVGTFAAQEKTVTADTSAKSVTPDSGKYLSKVTYNPTPTQPKSASPSTTSQTIIPDRGKHLSSVSISAISPQRGSSTQVTADKAWTYNNRVYFGIDYGWYPSGTHLDLPNTSEKYISYSSLARDIGVNANTLRAGQSVLGITGANQTGVYTPTGANLNNSAADMEPTNNNRYVNTTVCYDAGVSAQKSANNTKEITLMAPAQGSWCLFKLPFTCSKITWQEKTYQAGPYVVGDVARVRDSSGNQVGGSITLNMLNAGGTFTGTNLDQIQLVLAPSDTNRQVYIRFTCE